MSIRNVVNALVLTMGLLAGCGGGHDYSTPASTLSGVAAVGAPIVNGNITVSCTSGSALTTTTSLVGAWNVTLSGQTLPCAVQVSGGNIGTINGVANATSYHSLALALGTVNVTPLTDLLVANLAGTATPALWFAGLSTTPASFAAMNNTNLATALNNLRTALVQLPLSTTNPITTVFTPTPGNAIDNMLVALATAIANGGTNYAALLNNASVAGFTLPPAPFGTALVGAVCPAGQSLSLTVCSPVGGAGVGAGGTTPTVTGFSPATGAVGSTVTITGTNLGLGFQPAPIVKFGVTNAANPYTFVGQTSLTVTVPAGLAAGVHAITIGGMGGTPLTVGSFTVTAGGGGAGAGGFVTTCIANNFSHGVTPAQLTPFVRSYTANQYPAAVLGGALGAPGAAVSLAIAANGGITYNTAVQQVTSICQDNVNPALIYVQFLAGGPLSALDFFTDGGVTGNMNDVNLTLVQGGSCTTVAGCGTGGGVVVPPAVAGQMGGAIQGTPLVLTNTVTTSPWLSYLGEMTTDGTNYYIADGTFFRVTKFNPTTGLQTTLAGALTITPGFVDGTGAAAQFGALGGITTDGTNLYVSDISNHSIRKIVIATGVVTTLAGSGVAGGADGTGAAAQFNQPHGITTDNTNLYVADYLNNRIRKIVIATGVVTTLAGSGLATRIDGIGTAASFSLPYVITTDGTSLYESDILSGLIRRIDIATGTVTTMLSGGAGLPFASDIRGITCDGTNLYVADAGGWVVRKIVIATGVASLLAGGGVAVTATVDGVGALAKFSALRAIINDGISLYVADGQLFRKIQ